jgi:hypothetical protein
MSVKPFVSLMTTLFPGQPLIIGVIRESGNLGYVAEFWIRLCGHDDPVSERLI